MRVLGFEITRQKALPPLSPPSTRGGWWPLIRESFAGAWQRNATPIAVSDVSTNPTVWACVTLIAQDISKLWIELVIDEDGICRPTTNPAYSPVLRKPNHYQTIVKFIESWMLSKYFWGNTYVLKERNNRGGVGRGNVTAMYVLDPSSVLPLVAPNGDVYYQLGQDYLAGLVEGSLIVPASEMIHDLAVPLYHPLVGVSPIYACGQAALQGLKIQGNSSKLFENGSQPGGVLTAPHAISNETAERIQRHWESQFAGEANIGRVAVLGDGLHYEPMTMNAVDAQLIDQLKWSDERIASTFHVPLYKIGIGPAPPYTDIQSINLEYYCSALQQPVEQLETLLTEGLEMSDPYSVEVDEAALLRMDTRTQVDNATKSIMGGLMSPNEARAPFDLSPVPGGDSVYLQQQQYSLEALARRDAAPPTPALAVPAPSAPMPPEDMADDDLPEDSTKWLDLLEQKAASYAWT